MRLSARVIKVSWIFCFLISAVLAAGCNQGPPMGEVTGNVIVNGTPAKTGSISFFPLDGKSLTAGTEIIDGKYTAQVPVGKVKIEVRVSKIVGQRKLYPTPNSPVANVYKEVLPPKFNDQSELEMDVTKGTNEKDFDIKLN